MYLLFLLLASVAFIIYVSVRLKLHPFLTLLVASFAYGAASGTIPIGEIPRAVTDGYGGVVGSIGIIILAGSIIGVFLERSGGALRIAESVLRLVGLGKIPLAMSVLGYVVSIPVFCDSGFVILSPLNKALSRRTGSPLAAGAIALSLGLYATHTMVPPTPGPVAAAGLLNADLGLVTLWGLLVSFAALVAGYLFAVLVAARFEVRQDLDAPQLGPPLHPADSAHAAHSVQAAADSAGVERMAATPPTLIKSLLPIVVPVTLIVLNSVTQFPTEPFVTPALASVFAFMGNPTVALLIGVGLAFLLPRRLTPQMMSTRGWVGQATVTAATIIVITGAGGSFGRVLLVSGLPDVLTQYFEGMQIGVLMPFMIAASIKTAQGSSTVALITTAGIMAPLLEPFGLDSPTMRALTVVAIGAGSMVVSHANDSYFWVVTQLSNMTVAQGYRLQTLGSAVQGAAALLAVWVVSRFIAQ